MLVNFTFKNFRSCRDEMTLSMEAAPIKELSDAVFSEGGQNLLPVAVMYGSNSSGKSNVLKALKLMRDVVLKSVKLNPKDKLERDAFCLDVDSHKDPTSFEIQFVIDESKFRYGFDYNDQEIISEWLYERRPGEREYELFLRAGEEFNISQRRFAEGLGKKNTTPANRLFISLVAQLNGKLSQTILDWFANIEYISGMDGKGYADNTLEMIFNHDIGDEDVLKLLAQTDLGFDGIEVIRSTDGSDGIYSKTVHSIFDKDGNVVERRSFPTEKMESEGTKKMIEIAGPIFDAIISGKVLVIDDLDAKLHPFLTRKIISLFMDKEVNKKGAQLLFATHDTNLLNLQFLRRDQIWFAEKDRFGSTELFSLVEFKDASGKKVRNDRDIENDYINGRYGAIPILN